MPDDHPTIQQAILAAEDGNEIHVAPGVYNEAIDFLGRNIVIRSDDGPEVTIIDGQGISDSLVTFASGEGSGARLEGFTMTGGNATSGGALRVSGGASPTIVRCRFVENAAATGGAVEVAAGSAPEFINCIFRNNTAANGSAISATDAALTLTRCSYFDNIATEQAAIHLAGGEATIVEAALLGNSAPDAPGLHINGADVTLADSAILANTGSGGGAIVNAGGTLAINGTRFCANEPGDVAGDWTDGGGNELLTDCVTDPVVHVPADFASIQAAVDWSLTGFEVVVAPGEYFEAIDFKGRAITLRSSHGPEKTLIDATDRDGHGILIGSGEGPDTIVDGLTITQRAFNEFAGIAVLSGSRPTIRRCRIIDCGTGAQEAMQGGGNGLLPISARGMWVIDSAPLIFNSTFRNNQAYGSGAGVEIYESQSVFVQCDFEGIPGNDDPVDDVIGGGIWIYGGSRVELKECIVRNNRARLGGGIALYSGYTDNPQQSSLRAENCTIEGNVAVYSSDPAWGAGFAVQDSRAEFVNCVFEGNYAGEGAGAYTIGLCEATFESCQFLQNVALGLGGGILNYNLVGPNLVRVDGCLISDNVANRESGSGVATLDGSVTILESTTVCGNFFGQIYGDYIDEGGNVITDVCLLADFNNDGVVNVADLQILLSAWGACPDPDCPADLNGDGAVDVADLLILLTEWSFT